MYIIQKAKTKQKTKQKTKMQLEIERRKIFINFGEKKVAEFFCKKKVLSLVIA